MDIEAFREYCLKKKGVTEGFPFDQYTLVFKVMGKMFAIAPLERIPPQANLKAAPEDIPELREQYEGRILPGYHMSKSHWNTVLIEQLPEAFLRKLIDDSYNLIVASLPKKVRAELEGLPE
ncbi:MmcQ/YjbR family DNA-binding protein [Robiginitalea sp. M366]|uniref:MmcQ/YjbR family DNA-binding protein n=1 Tax=Robiginitalea aestuariiviva TaxID=3036903 RepID=UPI00240D73F6|nr:MmcQ/YjbR family DNA-binding protein [Robiginitalea aestuariiviva]MDG1571093.1 MmcQ/YjbR family DNA-binding protein [Robiginitalea aestuariiviva]